MWAAIAIASLVAFVAVFVLWMRARADLTRFRAITDAEAAARQIRASAETEASRTRAEADASTERLRAELRQLEADKTALEADIRKRREEWETKFKDALSEYERITREIGALNDASDLQSFGLYKPQYSFGASDAYKAQLERIRDQQARMLRDKIAATCPKQWTVDGNVAKGRQMTERNLKLMLRAFNGECDAAVAKVNYRNAVALEERIRKSFDAINKLGEPNFCAIVPSYLALKIEELRIAHEYEEKLQAEKEEQRRLREQMKEEEKANREIEKAKEDAEKEEARYAAALERAKREAEEATAAQRADVETKLTKLSELLEEAKAKKQRAISQAELTKTGHVYVLSNEGSFGPNMFKVGMTRRLEPMDRVNELSSASVPFEFDVHAIIKSDDAPGLETKLHQALEPHRVNLVNQRKEFFRVPLEKIVDIVAQHHGKISFTMLAEAAEYRKTLAIRAEREAMVTGREVRNAAAQRVDDLQARFEQMKRSVA